MIPKTDKELLEIWDNKEKSSRDWWLYGRLNPDEKMKLFDLIEYRKPIVNKNIELKGGLKDGTKKDNRKDHK